MQPLVDGPRLVSGIRRMLFDDLFWPYSPTYVAFAPFVSAAFAVAATAAVAEAW